MTNRNFTLHPLCCICVTILMAGASMSGATYSLQDLGIMTDTAGGSDSRPNGLSPNGKVAASNVANGAYRAFIFDGAWRNLGTLGGNESLGADVNDSGIAVGISTTTNGVSRAFLWTPGGTNGVPTNPQMSDLGTLGGSNSEAYSINVSGQISGYAQTASGDHAFVYSGGKMKDIGALLGAGLANSYGLSINDAGHVAGLAYNNNFSTPHAFYYDGTNAMDIGSLGENNASALGINNSDHIAGYSTTNGFDHAFRYFKGVMTDLGTLGGHYSYAIGINNSNTVVGGSFVDAGDTVYHAFIATGDSMTDLNDQLDASGTGWTLNEARKINDAGQIVGTGYLGGVLHTFLLNPGPSVNPVVTGVRANGADILVSFTTLAGGTYSVLARTNLVIGNWDVVEGGIPGTGAIVTVTNAGVAVLPERFYRVSASLP